MRLNERILVAVVVLMLCALVFAWAGLLHGSEWRSALHKAAYWPFTVELKVVDR